ncbi:MAG: transporter, partial [Cyclobacteriaceae bacterium]|nr:transporter [Cyclobacteriaceae bacterium]
MKKVVIIGILIVLAGCAVGPKYSRPETESPAAYTQAVAKTDSITNMKWWDVYQDTALKK